MLHLLPLLLAPALALANPLTNTLGPNLVNAQAPQLVSDVDADKLFVGSIGIQNDTNQNLGTHDSPTIQALRPELIKVDGSSKTASATGLVKNGPVTLLGVVRSSDSNKLGQTHSSALAVSYSAIAGNASLQPIAGIYYADAPGDQQTTATVLGLGAAIPLNEQHELRADAFQTRFQSDQKAGLDGATSIDSKLSWAGQMTPNFSLNAGLLHQNYDDHETQFAFSARGGWIGFNAQLAGFEVIGYLERKRLDYDGQQLFLTPVTPSLSVETRFKFDRKRERLALRVQKAMSMGLFGIEGLSDEFSGFDPANPIPIADRHQIRAFVNLPLLSH